MFCTAEVRDQMARWVAELEPGEFSAEDALRMLDVVSDLKRLAGAAETLLAARVAPVGLWKDEADRSAAHWLARRTGMSVAEAKAKLDTASRLADLPTTAEAYRAGRLSDQQAREVTAGAAADPDAEAELLDTAAADSLNELRNVSRRAQAAGEDDDARRRRVLRQRRVRKWVGSDGLYHFSFVGAPEEGAEVNATLAPFTEAAFKAAQTEGRREPLEAYAADGFMAMVRAVADGSAEGPARSTARNTKVIAVVDISALRRGYTEGDETCEIRGVGPVPVDAARRLLGDAALAIVLKKGTDVMNVTHLGRNLTAHQQTVVEWWGLRCEVKGCDCTEFIDVHHLLEYVMSGHTRLDELRVYCKHHHRAEHKGWKPDDDQIRKRPGRRPKQPAEPEDEPVLPLSA